jgi:hypothetical protein
MRSCLQRTKFTTAIADVDDPVVSALCSSWKSAKSTYEQALESGVRKSQIASGMEQGLREMPTVLSAFENGKRAQVLVILHNFLVMTFPEFFEQDAQLLAVIIERSKIRSVREYYPVRHRIDELEGETSALDERGLLHKLVDEFES